MCQPPGKEDSNLNAADNLVQIPTIKTLHMKLTRPKKIETSIERKQDNVYSPTK